MERDRDEDLQTVTGAASKRGIVEDLQDPDCELELSKDFRAALASLTPKQSSLLDTVQLSSLIAGGARV